MEVERKTYCRKKIIFKNINEYRQIRKNYNNITDILSYKTEELCLNDFSIFIPENLLETKN
jgi:hypothetical protein